MLPHNGTPTSIAAAQDAAPNAQQDRGRIYEFIRQRGIYGATCDEVEVALGLKHQTASARLAEMRGVVGKQTVCLVATDMIRRTRTGSKADVIVIIDLRDRITEREQPVSKADLRNAIRAFVYAYETGLLFPHAEYTHMKELI